MGEASFAAQRLSRWRVTLRSPHPTRQACSFLLKFREKPFPPFQRVLWESCLDIFQGPHAYSENCYEAENDRGILVPHRPISRHELDEKCNNARDEDSKSE